MISDMSGLSSGMMGPSMAQRQAKMEQRFNGLDVNSDGSLNKTEFESFTNRVNDKTGSDLDIETIFDQFDTNQDGVVDAEEMRENMKGFREENGLKLSGRENMSVFVIQSDSGLSTMSFLEMFNQVEGNQLDPQYTNLFSYLINDYE